ncbi:class I SAM-dependent methyltransferase [Polluticaenibacter yanchengensis]|uniref:Class I SAM-dependent methyltransferase n=1 Tax=Polluticaenibacter yanchengensis TaxID=3014562 RepID=A0ABT4UH32_9BACT|nr:class I SAM-dependent methyltransferase [Chitinophagaceae bacterium LY-5]
MEVSKIIEQYQKEFKLDVSGYFKGLQNINIYECLDTHLRYYYPFGLSGDGAFYDYLSNFQNEYYPKDKWDFEEASKYIKKDDAVLEIGCGEGHFLNKIQTVTKNCIGLELSSRAVKLGQDKGLNILNELIQSHSSKNAEEYDVVAAFQLFEHVEGIVEMFQSSVKALKKGGKLIITVPNNSSLIFKLNKYQTLNTPPHHMLLWDEKSLTAVAGIFGLKLISLETQPPTKILKSAVYKLQLEKWFGNGELAPFIHKTSRWFVKMLPLNLMNHSILAVYEKL